MDGKKYDYKEAYNKNLTPKARLHYLENARHDQDAKCPSCGSPLHSNCSPARMKYEVKDINKNGKIDGWEKAKYDAINKSAEKDSPLDFLGNIAASIRTARRARDIASQVGMGNNAMAQVGKARQAQASNTGNISGRLDEIDSRLSAIEDLSAESASQPEMTNVPPDPSNTMGNARPVFSQPVQQNAQKMFGSVDMMQNSVAAPPLFKKKCNKYKK